MSSPQQEVKKVTPRPKKETPEEITARWRKWRRIAIFTVGGLLLAYYSWTYIFSGMFRRMNAPKLPPDVSIEEVVAEFDEDPEAAAKKYANKRIVVVGKLVLHVGGPDEPFDKRGKTSIYYEIPGGEEGNERKVPVVFFDTDDASSTEAGDSVRLSGVFEMEGPGKYKLVAAGGEAP